MNVWNWCRHAWNQAGIIISIYDISLIQFLFCKNTINLKECVAAIALLLYKKHHSWKKWLHLKLWINSIPFKKRWLQVLAQRITVTWKLLDRCKWPSEIGNWNICQIYCIYSIHGCRYPSEKYHIHWRMVGRNYFHETKKYSTLRKTVSSRLNAVIYEEGMLFRNNYFG